MGAWLFLFGLSIAICVLRCSALNCMECTDVPNPTTCEQITTCPRDSRCLVRQYITTAGAVLYSSGCRSVQAACPFNWLNTCITQLPLYHQRCGGNKRYTDVEAEDSTNDLETCDQCCDGDYCNIEGCSTKVIDRSQRGPYCFECSVENGVYGCRNIKRCDQGQLCSIDRSNFPDLYTTTCIPDTKCNSLQVETTQNTPQLVGKRAAPGITTQNTPQLVGKRAAPGITTQNTPQLVGKRAAPGITTQNTPQLVGKRAAPGITISLPYCCQGDFCNDVIKFITNSTTAVDGMWTRWGDWSSCSTSCGYGGTQSRGRSCDNPPAQNDGAACVGDEAETRNCLTQQCPIDGGWADWTDWSSCSMSCGQDAHKLRSRTCSNPAPQHNGMFCQGNYTELTQCQVPECPIDGAWSVWGQWSACPVTCGTQVKIRQRTCTNPAPQYNGTGCNGTTHDFDRCHDDVQCTVDGEWSEWEAWSACSHSCGSHGHVSRNRTCDNPSPAFGGRTCNGDSTETDTCNHFHCPVDGKWTDWGAWSDCSQTCGTTGTHHRTRNCTYAQPLFIGESCPGNSEDIKGCNHLPCPVDGHWSNWGEWSACSKTCGVDGWRTRNHTCDNPPPAHGGHSCHGRDYDSEKCNRFSCPVDGQWSDWGSWSSCTHSCGTDGQHQQTRTCSDPAPANGGQACPGTHIKTQDCQRMPCPVDGGWSHWGAWTPCSRTCGSAGTTSKNRTCNDPAPAFNGAECVGQNHTTIACNTHPNPCPVDGQWSNWGAWSSCSPTCGSHRTRTRTCNNPAPAHGGHTCHGSSTHDHQCDPCAADVCRTHHNFEPVTITENNKTIVLCLSVADDHTGQWTEGRKKCQHLHSDLVVVTSAERNAAIAQFASTHLKHGESYFWIGLVGGQHHHTWTWVDQSQFSFTRIDNQHSPHSDDCGLASIAVKEGWYKTKCNQHYPPVCEIKV